MRKASWQKQDLSWTGDLSHRGNSHRLSSLFFDEHTANRMVYQVLTDLSKSQSCPLVRRTPRILSALWGYDEEFFKKKGREKTMKSMAFLGWSRLYNRKSSLFCPDLYATKPLATPLFDLFCPKYFTHSQHVFVSYGLERGAVLRNITLHYSVFINTILPLRLVPDLLKLGIGHLKTVREQTKMGIFYVHDFRKHGLSHRLWKSKNIESIKFIKGKFEGISIAYFNI